MHPRRNRLILQASHDVIHIFVFSILVVVVECICEETG